MTRNAARLARMKRDAERRAEIREAGEVARAFVRRAQLEGHR
jgi:hypothetical protein